MKCLPYCTACGTSKDVSYFDVMNVSSIFESQNLWLYQQIRANSEVKAWQWKLKKQLKKKSCTRFEVFLFLRKNWLWNLSICSINWNCEIPKLLKIGKNIYIQSENLKVPVSKKMSQHLPYHLLYKTFKISCNKRLIHTCCQC